MAAVCDVRLWIVPKNGDCHIAAIRTTFGTYAMCGPFFEVWRLKRKPSRAICGDCLKILAQCRVKPIRRVWKKHSEHVPLMF
jgi:hypothetical protein